jgi:hypothetical protein
MQRHGSGWAVIRVLKDRNHPHEYRLDDRGRLIEKLPRNARRRLSGARPGIPEFPQLQVGPVPAALAPSLAHIDVLRSAIVFPASILQTPGDSGGHRPHD